MYLNKVNDIFSFLGPITDFLWEFPRNLDFYRGIPILGNFSLSILLLIGCGIYFSLKLKFVQIRYFKRSIQILKKK
ncbi:MAG: alanine/glycine:cation symporter family protein, partial [Fusobacteriaceae bacterium]